MTVRPFILFTCFSFLLCYATFSQSGYDVLVKNGLTGIKDSLNHIDEFKDGFARIFDKNNKINYINRKGQKINPQGAISAYSRESGSFPEHYFVYWDTKTKYFGLLDTAGQVVLQPDYTHVSFFGKFIQANQKGKTIILDEKVKTVVEFPNENITGVNNSFLNILVYAPEEKDRKRGIYDLVSKKMIIPYDFYEVIHDLPWGFITRKDGFEGLFDLSGKLIIPLGTYTRLSTEANGNSFIHAVNAQGHAVIDSLGKVIIPAGLYDDVWAYNKETDMFLVFKDHKSGVVNIRNQVIIPIEYSELGGVSDPSGILSATKNGNKFFISKKNYNLGTFKYTARDGYRKYINNDTTGYVDESGQIHPFPAYKKMADYNKNGFIVCSRNDKWGLMNADFKLVIDTAYDYISDTYKGYFVVKKNNKEGVIDVYGKIHIPVTNERVNVAGNFTFAVSNEDKKEIITVKKIEFK